MALRRCESKSIRCHECTIRTWSGRKGDLQRSFRVLSGPFGPFQIFLIGLKASIEIFPQKHRTLNVEGIASRVSRVQGTALVFEIGRILRFVRFHISSRFLSPGAESSADVLQAIDREDMVFGDSLSLGEHDAMVKRVPNKFQNEAMSKSARSYHTDHGPTTVPCLRIRSHLHLMSMPSFGSRKS